MLMTYKILGKMDNSVAVLPEKLPGLTPDFLQNTPDFSPDFILTLKLQKTHLKCVFNAVSYLYVQS